MAIGQNQINSTGQDKRMGRNKEATMNQNVSYEQNKNEDFREAASSIKSDVQQLGQASKKAAKEALDTVRKNATEYYQQGKEKAQELEKTLEGQIRNHPVRSLMVAAGAALLLTALWRGAFPMGRGSYPERGSID